jgi:hypothetical protein
LIDNNTYKQVQKEEAPENNERYKKEDPSDLVLELWVFTDSNGIHTAVHYF